MSQASCESFRPRTPLTYGGAESEGLHERGSNTVLPFLIQATSQDETYGCTANNPVRVGGGREAGVRNQQRSLNAPLGPRGETLSYQPECSCCAFKIAEAGIDNEGQLHIYSISWKDRKEPLKLYLNLYEEGPLAAPVGLRAVR